MLIWFIKREEEVLSGKLVPVGEGGYRERGQEGEYSANTVYTYV
jgi:hypothetical protein